MSKIAGEINAEMRPKHPAMYFTTTVSSKGLHYWMLHQNTGHILRTSEPFTTMHDCVDNLANEGWVEYWNQRKAGLV